MTEEGLTYKIEKEYKVFYQGKRIGSFKVDLLIEDKDNNYIVVDFKTDKFRNPEIHEKQLLTYITAVKRLHPNSCVKGCVVYLRSKDKEYFY